MDGSHKCIFNMIERGVKCFQIILCKIVLQSITCFIWYCSHMYSLSVKDFHMRTALVSIRFDQQLIILLESLMRVETVKRQAFQLLLVM